jgi:hypothetical protein
MPANIDLNPLGGGVRRTGLPHRANRERKHDRKYDCRDNRPGDFQFGVAVILLRVLVLRAALITQDKIDEKPLNEYENDGGYPKDYIKEVRRFLCCGGGWRKDILGDVC